MQTYKTQDNLKNIFLHLQDETSKWLFEKRMMYSLTGDESFINQIIKSLLQKYNVDSLMEKVGEVKERLIVYGAGNDFLLLSRLYPVLNGACLCDRDQEKQKTGWIGHHVISPEQLLKDYQDYYVLISTTMFQDEIEDFLIKNGWDKSKILNPKIVASEWYSQQYFDEEIMKPCPNEIFIDGGCYDCSTDRLFIKWCGGDYKKIYAFEPDIKNYEKCLKEADRIPNLELANKGLWSREETLHFAGGAEQGSRIIETKDQSVTTISVAAIDDVVGEDKVTFIKMDVEGAELEALKGARKTIMKHHPRLAISIYHKPEDIWEIPAYILSLSKDYRLYIRHYQLSKNETILYAV